MLEQDVYFFKKIKKQKLKRQEIEASGNRLKEPNLLEISKVFDEYYFLNKLRLYCAYLSYYNIVNPQIIDYSKIDFLLIKEIIQLVDSNTFITPRLDIYNQIRELYENIDAGTKVIDQLYTKILLSIKKMTKTLKAEEQGEIYSFLANFCIKRFNSGEVKYIQNYFLISIKLLELKHRSRKKKLQGIVFKNIVVTALKLKDSVIFKENKINDLPFFKVEKKIENAFDWIDCFISSIAPKINKKDRSLYVPYCKAIVEFERNNFFRAYKILQNPMRKRGIFINMNLKVLNLKILYEINTLKPIILEYDNVKIEKVLEAFRGLIRDEINRKKELNYQSDFYIVFEAMFRKLYRFYCNYAGVLYNNQNEQFLQEKKELKDEIDKIEYSYKGWFENKLSQIR